MRLTLDEFVKLKGVTVAFEFNVVGACTQYQSNIDLGPEMCATIAEYCGLVTRTFSTLADAFTTISEQILPLAAQSIPRLHASHPTGLGKGTAQRLEPSLFSSNLVMAGDDLRA